MVGGGVDHRSVVGGYLYSPLTCCYFTTQVGDKFLGDAKGGGTYELQYVETSPGVFFFLQQR